MLVDVRAWAAREVTGVAHIEENTMNASRFRGLAVGLALPWASWWVFFAIASSLSGGLGSAVIPALIAGVILFGSVGVAWKWEPIGGTLLIFEGLIVVGAYVSGVMHNISAATMVFVMLTGALPPIAAGMLFHMAWMWRQALGSR